MKQVNTENKAIFLKSLADAFHEKLSVSEANQVTEFCFQFLGGLPVEEFKGKQFTDVYGSVIESWRYLQQHKKNTQKVAVFNPNLEQNGWQSTHTVIAILDDNLPFLVDSIRLVLNQLELTIHGIQHAVLFSERTASGKFLKLLSNSPDSRDRAEALMMIEVDRQSSKPHLENLEKTIDKVLTEVRIATSDYPSMLNKAQSLIPELKQLPKSFLKEKISAAKDFIEWMIDNNFTFLGYVEYELTKKGEIFSFDQVKGTELGILKSHNDIHKHFVLEELPKHTKDHLFNSDIFTFAKSSQRSRVHRPAYPDYISIKRFNKKGEVVGEHRFLGLYTAQVYNERPHNIPLIKDKVQFVMDRSGMNVSDYAGKELDQLLAVYPRDELFQIHSEELYDVAMGILYIQARRKIRVFMREDPYGRFIYCLVYVPRDVYSTELRIQMEGMLLDELGGQDIDSIAYFSESVMARVQFTVKVEMDKQRQLDTTKIQQNIIEMAQSWQDGLEIALYDAFGEEQANSYIHRFKRAFPTGYRDKFSPRRVVSDIEHMVEVAGGKPLSMSFYRSLEEDETILHFKLFHADSSLPLSDVLPIFENMGFRVLGEHPFETRDRNNKKVFIHDFTLTTIAKLKVNLQKIQDIFEDLFEKVWAGDAENDPFNRLVKSCYLNWRQIAIFRSYARYMRQVRVSNSQRFISNTLVNNPDITRLLLQYFEAKFCIDNFDKQNKYVAVREKIEIEFNQALNNVKNLTEDKILRLFLDLMKATLRTNYYQPDLNGQPKTYMSFKFKSDQIPGVPLPVPLFEIFVYSPRVEGVHLRGGKVARGGLRWSDRYEDYRTEVLGLVKAQQVKNAIIVPVGAKGGFVAKKLPVRSNREAFSKEGIESYKIFVSGLLDLTDNLVEGEISPPFNVVKYDEDDHYLVVAADKGTATFSDIANGLAADYNFWLGDAFASGGSHGYDHKKMGITARGAWVSVERHFREMGINTATDEHSIIGIGDMSGDVFGNGLLRSPHSRLLAAFNHIDIFIDPDPDVKASFEERQRLFNLPRSGWSDYNNKLISKGGGIFSRSDKSIPVSQEMKKAFNITANKVPPNMLISYLLKAEVDLIWIGGIGTYFKASFETHADVGDKANDPLRINGSDIRAKVISEGGNLGCTQLSRVEFALKGGRLNTDFIDNASGVDCSDHEVNIKILLNEVVANGDMTEKQRNAFLSEMTEEIADLVLSNNYRQTQAISIAEYEVASRMEEYRRLINNFESAGKLNRELEFIPNDEEITERKSKKQGLTRPELSVLISYVKGDLKETLNDSSFTNNKVLTNEVTKCFPSVLVNKFGRELAHHRLRSEIIATQIANDLVNHMGITFVERLKQSTGSTTASVALSYIIARKVFSLDSWWHQIEALDNQVPAIVQKKMMGELMRLMRRACRWLLRNRRSELNVVDNMDSFAKGIAEVAGSLGEFLSGAPKEAWQKMYDELIGQSVPETLAAKISGASHLYSALGIIEAQESTGVPLKEVSTAFYKLGDRLDLNWFVQQLNLLTPATHWQALARETFREDLDWQQRSLTVSVIKMKNTPKDIKQRLDIWMDYHSELVDRWNMMLTELKASKGAEYAMYSVALRELLDLAQSTAHAVSAGLH